MKGYEFQAADSRSHWRWRYSFLETLQQVEIRRYSFPQMIIKKNTMFVLELYQDYIQGYHHEF